MTVKKHSFISFAWGFLAFNVLVINWGALVRATGSGAGCGAHWPLCNGNWIPIHPQFHTSIELIHRLMSGVSLLGALGLCFAAMRVFPKKSFVRYGATASLALMLSEALIGAGLVLLRLVAQNTSLLRAGYLSIHLVNTFFLLGALTWTAWAASGSEKRFDPDVSQTDKIAIGIGFVALLMVNVTGGIAALGDTLFPAASLQQGWTQDFAVSAHWLLRLRIFHPILAAMAGGYIGFLAIRGTSSKNKTVRNVAKLLFALVLIQWAVGVWNLSWLAPVALQLAHLFFADGLWIGWIIFALTSTTPPV